MQVKGRVSGAYRQSPVCETRIGWNWFVFTLNQRGKQSGRTPPGLAAKEIHYFKRPSEKN